MTTGRELYYAARDLRRQYTALDEAKLASQQSPRGERIMKPNPGPRPPAPILLISLDKYLVDRLAEVVSECMTHINPSVIITRYGHELCLLVEDYCVDIADLAVADDLHALLVEQEEIIHKRLNPPTTGEVAAAPEKYMLARDIQKRLSALGYPTTLDTIRGWARSGHITTHPIPVGTTTRNGYRLSECLQHLKDTHAPHHHTHPQ